MARNAYSRTERQADDGRRDSSAGISSSPAKSEDSSTPTLIGYEDAYTTLAQAEPIGRSAAKLNHGWPTSTRSSAESVDPGLSCKPHEQRTSSAQRRVQVGKATWQGHINPVDGFDLPTSRHIHGTTPTPELDDFFRLLASADRTRSRCSRQSQARRNDRYATRRALRPPTGSAAPRTTRTIVDNCDQRRWRRRRREANKDKKQPRRSDIDDATVNLLSRHIAAMDDPAALPCNEFAPDAFVFSLDATCRTSHAAGIHHPAHACQLRSSGHDLTDGELRRYNPRSPQMDKQPTDGRRLQSRQR